MTTTGGQRPSEAAGDDLVDLSTMGGVLRREWFVVVLSLAVFVGLAFAYAALTPPTWRSTVRLLLDPRDKQLVGAGADRVQTSVEPAWIETRQELVKAYSTLAAVAAKENLVADEEIMGPHPEARTSAEPIGDAVRALSEKVLVERPKENNLIDVSVTTRSPEKSQRLAAAIADAFVDQLAATKVDQLGRAEELLAHQIDDVRAKMLAAENAVEAYRRDHGILTTRGNLVDEETLRQSNEALVAARTRTQQARERSDRMRRVLASGDPTVDSQIDTLGSAVLSRLKIEAAMADRRRADLEQTYGARHPRVVAAAAEAGQARSQILDEIKSLAATADLDYEIARANEDAAHKAVDRAEARLTDTNRAAVGLQELENEAAARRELYKSFVSRMEETTLQRRTQVSDASVVSPAQMPLHPYAPRRTLALALGAVAGLGFGIAWALWRGHRGLARDAARRAAVGASGTSDAAVAPVADTAPVAAAASLVAPMITASSSEAAAPPAAPATASSTAAPRWAEAAPPPAATPSAATPAVASSAPLVAPTSTGEPAAAPFSLEDFLHPTEPAHSADTPAAPAISATIDGAPTDGASADATPAVAAPVTEAPTDVPAEPVAERLRRVDYRLSLDRIARLGAEGPGAGATAALVETAEGAPDGDALARLAELARDLDAGRSAGVCVLFSNTVPTLMTAALAHGLARAALRDGPVALLDLSHEGDVLDAAFADGELIEPDAAAATEVAVAHAFEWVREPSGLDMLRPLDPIPVGDPEGHPAETPRLVRDLAGLRGHVVVHLGRAPTAALLFDTAAVADRMILVVDESERDDRRSADEVDVMARLLPAFRGLVVLRCEDPEGVSVEPDDEARPAAEPRRRRARA